MAKFAVLLRGINVGGSNKVGMADLRALLGELGFTEVKTLLQSGNAVFDAPKGTPAQLAEQIEKALEERYGRVIGCVVVTRADLDRIVEANPLAGIADKPSYQLVTFLNGKPEAKLFADDDATAYAPEVVLVGEREIHSWHPNGQANSKLSPTWWKKRLPGLVATARNWNTVLKLRDLLD
ncbi:MAG: DUF1697 domain-containing protein [Hamadaea sp.]|uniref:DUF1697 domain-containing protein n=1 Tax=Hamadaea sp. TaxID=2024425 RepID=UPI0018023588|nr:DUF1697 domain-containing protein [Hamadaea sp.]NUT19631.1 DUF1697 domain-containing protein [Hamadaea sp.]